MGHAHHCLNVHKSRVQKMTLHLLSSFVATVKHKKQTKDNCVSWTTLTPINTCTPLTPDLKGSFRNFSQVGPHTWVFGCAKDMSEGAASLHGQNNVLFDVPVLVRVSVEL